MSKKNNIIEINGKRYDAHSGEALDGSAPTVHHSSAHHQAVHQPAKKVVPDVVRAPAKAAQAHAQQPSKTLMRRSVKKPGAGATRHLKSQTHTGHLVKNPVLPKHSAQHLHEGRLKHASRTPQSHLIQHFNPIEPVIPEVVPPSRPTYPTTGGKHHAASKKPSHHDLLDHAIARATSHKEPSPKRHRKVSMRITGISAAAFGLVLLGGVMASQSLPGMKLHMAASKAGIAASLPDYKPAGYHLGSFNSSPGVVAISYQSNSDGRSYVITEKTSDWDSDTLRDDFVAHTGQPFQAFDAAGRTVYLYGEHDATWVSGGVWYQVHTDGALSDHQLIQLASSI